MPGRPSNQGIAPQMHSSHPILGKSRFLPSRETVHPGSKPGFTHLTDVAQDIPSRIARALAWSQRTGRPVPPHMRFRRPLPATVPLGIRDRHNRYAAQNHAEDMTPAQLSRARHKHGRRELEAFQREHKLAVFQPPEPGPRRRLSVAALRRAKKDAAQKARHADRLLLPAIIDEAQEMPWSRLDANPLADIATIGRKPSGLS